MWFLICKNQQKPITIGTKKKKKCLCQIYKISKRITNKASMQKKNALFDFAIKNDLWWNIQHIKTLIL